MRALDLFAGAGGWDVAAKRLGIHPDGVEIMPAALETRVAAGLETVGHDVWNYDLNVGYNYDGLIASPPCQTFSLAGKGKGRDALDKVLHLIDRGWDDIADLRKQGEVLGDDRTALVLTPLHYAYEMRPEWIAWEQVPTVLPVWEACATQLFNMGYSVWTGNLQAEQYGVPQTRKRAFLLASRTRDVGKPEPTHSRYYPRSPEKLDEGVKKWISMAEALGWGLQERPSPTVTGGGTETGGAEPIAKWDRYTSRPDFLRMTKMANSAARPIDHPAPTIAFGHDANSARWFKGDEWMFHRPATSVQGDPRIWPPGHKVNADDQRRLGEAEANERYGDRAGTQSVRVTVQEAGVLQSFPADYPWQGAKGKQFLQVGNAVPPLLAEAVLSTVVS